MTSPEPPPGNSPSGSRPRQPFRLRRRRYLGALGKGRDPVRPDEFSGRFRESLFEPDFPPPPGPVAVRRPARGFYLLPNAITTGGLFAGFYAVVMAMNERFDVAAIAIFVAMLLDSLDGRVARLTHTQSAFGEQYDSLADMVSFGAAPALIMYAWALKTMGKLGWLAAFIYVAGAALRLARFNTNLGVVDKRWFQGLPSPAAAALVVGLVWVATDLRDARWINATGADLRWLGWAITVFAGITMVASVPFYSFKDLNLRRAVPFVFVLLLVAGFVLISSDPPTMLFLLFVGYGLSGYVMWAWRAWSGKPRVELRPSAPPPESPSEAPASAGSAGSAGATVMAAAVRGDPAGSRPPEGAGGSPRPAVAPEAPDRAPPGEPARPSTPDGR